MTPSARERFLAVFHGERVSPLPCVYDLTYWRDAHLATGDLPERYRGHDGFLALHRDLGVMPYYLYSLESDAGATTVPGHELEADAAFSGVWSSRRHGVETRTESSGGVQRSVTRVGGRELVEERTWLPQSSCFSVSRHPVAAPRDLQTLRMLYERLEFQPAYERYRAVERRWGSEGYPLAVLPRSPVSSLVVDWMGLEAFTYAVQDESDEIRKTLDCIERANEPAFDIVCRSEPEVFHFADNISGTMVSSFFDELMAPLYRRLWRRLHEAGKKAAVHIDGTVRGILRRFADCGADAAESLTPLPVGDVALPELRAEAASPSIILWGGIPASMLAPSTAAAEMDDHMRLLVSCLGELEPFIAGSADQVPPDADLGRVRRTTRVFEELAGS